MLVRHRHGILFVRRLLLVRLGGLVLLLLLWSEPVCRILGAAVRRVSVARSVVWLFSRLSVLRASGPLLFLPLLYLCAFRFLFAGTIVCPLVR